MVTANTVFGISGWTFDFPIDSKNLDEIMRQASEMPSPTGNRAVSIFAESLHPGDEATATYADLAKDRAEHYGLKLVLTGFRPEGKLLHAIGDEGDQAQHDIMGFLNFAERIGVGDNGPVVGIDGPWHLSHSVFHELSDDPCEFTPFASNAEGDAYLARLKNIDQRAYDLGIDMGMEPMWRGEANFTNRVEQIIYIADAAGLRAIGINVDPAHQYREETNPIDPTKGLYEEAPNVDLFRDAMTQSYQRPGFVKAQHLSEMERTEIWGTKEAGKQHEFIIDTHTRNKSEAPILVENFCKGMAAMVGCEGEARPGYDRGKDSLLYVVQMHK